MKNLVKIASVGCLLAATGFGLSAFGSSHREAPGVANDPAADITDVYTFKAEGTRASTHQAFVMNVSPAYVPSAGPNWYRFDDETMYEVNIDNTGDGVEDVTYQFRFKTYNDKTADANVNVIGFLPGVTWDDTAKKFTTGSFGELPLRQTYTVTKVLGGRRKGTTSTLSTSVGSTFPVAPPRIGPGTTDGSDKATTTAAKAARYAAYKSLVANAIMTTTGDYKFFAGPRNDPFAVDLGGIFNGVSLRIAGLNGGGTAVDSLATSNVLSIIFEVPTGEIIPDSTKPYFGVWATTSRPQASVRKISGKDGLSGGGYVQIARLGNPLVNEVVIGYKDKDKFNATQPKDDAANFASYVVKPQLAYLMNVLYGSSGGNTKNVISDVGLDNRTDLVDVFVKGIDGVNRYPSASGTGDMIRVNRDLKIGGAAIEGWPLNGRKITDNVVKTSLTFVAECKVLTEYGNYDVSGIWSNHTKATTTNNCALDSGASETATVGGTGVYDGAKFPYLDLPHSAWGE